MACLGLGGGVKPLLYLLAESREREIPDPRVATLIRAAAAPYTADGPTAKRFPAPAESIRRAAGRARTSCRARVPERTPETCGPIRRATSPLRAGRVRRRAAPNRC